MKNKTQRTWFWIFIISWWFLALFGILNEHIKWYLYGISLGCLIIALIIVFKKTKEDKMEEEQTTEEEKPEEENSDSSEDEE